jgi:hypothetical protein
LEPRSWSPKLEPPSWSSKMEPELYEGLLLGRAAGAGRKGINRAASAGSCGMKTGPPVKPNPRPLPDGSENRDRFGTGAPLKGQLGFSLNRPPRWPILFAKQTREARGDKLSTVPEEFRALDFNQSPASGVRRLAFTVAPLLAFLGKTRPVVGDPGALCSPRSSSSFFYIHIYIHIGARVSVWVYTRRASTHD